MELQTNDKEPTTPRTTTANTAATAASTTSKQSDISTSVPALRFPRPQGSERLATWISNSSPDLRQPLTMSDTSSLADSAYEIINGPDSEDQTDALTESTSSLGAPRPDDVHSLDGSDPHYDTDTGDESDDASRASSIRYADQVLQNPSPQLSTSNQSIEFHEGDNDSNKESPFFQDKIMAKHVIREFTEEETAALAKDWDMSNPPKRLVASIGQTMSQGYLATEEPLRIVYVGPSEQKREIVLKLSNAVFASSMSGTRDEDTLGRHREGVYNIVPVASFGPTPELELMEASHYQIKVEHCTSASTLVVKEPPEGAQPDLYSITIGHDTTYETYFTTAGGHVVQPKWTLPHISIFFIAEDDNEEDYRTRQVAWDLMSRLGVPSIFISDTQSFAKPPVGRWREPVGPDGLHICLESRDPERPITPVRLPIDFASFTNIDSRQMNRNLAHMTGLYESSEKLVFLEENKMEHDLDEKTCWTGKEFLEQAVRVLEKNKWLATVIFSVITSLFLTLLGVTPLMGSTQSNPVSAISGVASTSTPITPVVNISPTSIRATHTSTTTVVINVTSTKTVELSRSQPSTSTLASALSFAGFLSDKPSAAPVESPAKKTWCSARVYGPKEILITLPQANKASWLAKGAIEIDVWRGHVPLPVRLSSVDEGILINLGQNDAHGAFNVTVVTTRRPKINETLEVDFGRPVLVEAISAGMNMLFDIAKAVSSTTNEAVHLVEDTCAPAAAKLRGEASSIKDHILEASRVAQNRCGESINQVKRSLGPEDMAKLFKDTKDQLSRQLKTAEKIREGVDMSILQAQITSRLWWLKLQGKKEEYTEYQRNATRLLKMKYSGGAEEQVEKASSKDCSGIFGKRRCMQQLKRSARSRDTTKDSRWRKKIMG
ncbi:hypothetical protein B0H66DRAFT_194105 [Apodospora peruviana]|uniref:Uncharacterized protein n=1 Tax=Apodospora peruviana TaxID=516989 RepID=A0AAE0M8T7_9PEZI|nr:hypothetical protein B0H66DRAFT_194105 [Apodospora peruviana]